MSWNDAPTSKRAVAPIAIAVICTATACTPFEIGIFRSLSPSAQGAVALELATPSCHRAVDLLWPKASRAWAHRIVHRESRGNPYAQNRGSSAAGCFQLLKLHAWRFLRVGYTWADRYHARANVLAALHLFHEQGARPWR
jgi:Transglycosylase SLT domain